MIFLLIKAGIFSFPWLLRPWSDGGQKFEIDPEIGRVLDKWLLRQDSGAQTNQLRLLKALEMELYIVVSISSGDLVHKNYKPHFKMLRQYSCLHKRLEKVL